ncbi:hypothetical protein [Oceanobacter mangrovi]|uniref:hypothetical protein n=1 Tax=Oceanobacter mangrovi TaxID=2862510 RepID=UPI001C8EEB60|nr:hypothetical protein [Oceanobacter mangrovi]
MTLPLEEVKEHILHLYYMDFLKDHYGLLSRHDVCIALDFEVWLETHHSALMDFGSSKTERFNMIRDWIKHPDLDYHELLDYFNSQVRKQ